MLKSSVLIERKRSLRSQLEEIEAAIAEEVKRLDQARLNIFIEKGRLSSINGHRIDRFRRERANLLAVEKGLNRTIQIARERERLSEAKKVEDDMKKLERSREDLRAKLQKKREEVGSLDSQVRKLSADREELRADLSKRQLSKVEHSFKLPELGKFLSSHYICHPQELKEAVLKAIEENREKFRPGLVRPMGFERSDVTQGFKLVLSLDSGVMLRLEPFGPSVGLALHNPNIKADCLGGEK